MERCREDKTDGEKGQRLVHDCSPFRVSVSRASALRFTAVALSMGAGNHIAPK
jgi:hypothetical protein